MPALNPKQAVFLHLLQTTEKPVEQIMREENIDHALLGKWMRSKHFRRMRRKLVVGFITCREIDLLRIGAFAARTLHEQAILAQRRDSDPNKLLDPSRCETLRHASDAAGNVIGQRQRSRALKRAKSKKDRADEVTDPIHPDVAHRHKELDAALERLHAMPT